MSENVMSELVEDKEKIIQFAEIIKEYREIHDAYTLEMCLDEDEKDGAANTTVLLAQAKQQIESTCMKFIHNIEYMLSDDNLVNVSDNHEWIEYDLFGIFKIKRAVNSPHLEVYTKDSHWFSDTSSTWSLCNLSMFNDDYGLLEADENNCLIDWHWDVSFAFSRKYNEEVDEYFNEDKLKDRDFIIFLAIIGMFDLQKYLCSGLAAYFVKWKRNKGSFDENRGFILHDFELVDAVVEVDKLFSEDMLYARESRIGAGKLLINIFMSNIIEESCHSFRRIFYQGFLDNKTLRYFIYKYEFFSVSRYVSFLNEYQDYFLDMDFWEKDNPLKLMYLLRLNFPKESLRDKSFFSRDRLIYDGTQAPQAYKFPSKAAVKMFFKLPIRLAVAMIKPCCWVDVQFVEEENKLQRIRWFVALCWLLSSRVEIKEAHVDSFYRTCGKLEKIKDAALVARLEQVGFAVDLVFQKNVQLGGVRNQSVLDSDQEKKFLENLELSSSIDEIWDYLGKKNAEQTQYNLCTVTANITGKSIAAKIKKWHKSLHEYNLKELRENSEKCVNCKHPLLVDYNQGKTRFVAIKSNLELMEEGIEMDNCIYSFDENIRSEEYLAFKAYRGEERATVGFDLNGCLSLDQYKCKGNTITSNELGEDAEELAELLRMKNNF